MDRLKGNGTGKDSWVIQLKPVGIVRNQTKKSNWDAGFNEKGWQEKAATMKARS